MSLPADDTLITTIPINPSQDSDEPQPSSPPLDQTKPQIPPLDEPCPTSKAAAAASTEKIITLNPNGTVRPSPKVVINGIAPHVLDERKSRPRTPVTTSSLSSTPRPRSSTRNLRRLQYIQQQQQRQRQLEREAQAQASRCRNQQSVWLSQTRCQYPMCPNFDSSPLRICTFEGLQAQMEFLVDTKEGIDEKSRSCPVEIPIKSEFKLKSHSSGGVQVETTKQRSRGWKSLKIHVDVHVFKSIVLKFKHGT